MKYLILSILDRELELELELEFRIWDKKFVDVMRRFFNSLKEVVRELEILKLSMVIRNL